MKGTLERAGAQQWLRGLLFASAVMVSLSMQRPAAAAIVIDGSSKVMLLHGYSIELKKQELTPIHPLLNIVLPPMAADLKAALKVDVQYQNEAGLMSMWLPAMSRGAPEMSTEEFLIRDGYTHLAVPRIVMSGRESGTITLQIAPVSKKISLSEAEQLEPIKIDVAESNGNLDAIRRSLVVAFTTKYGGPKPRATRPQKSVRVRCILPRTPKGERSTAGELDQLDLEGILSPMLTHGLIDFYGSGPMKKKGYESTVNRYTYNNFGPTGRDLSKCYDIATKMVDYEISGVVGVRNWDSGYDLVEVGITLVYSASDCTKSDSIEERIDKTTVYQERQNFAVRFSKQVLPGKFEPLWQAFESKPCQ